MLATAAHSFSEDDISNIAAFLVRYANGREYAETELETLHSLIGSPLVPWQLIQQVFLEEHSASLKLRCVEEFCGTSWYSPRSISAESAELLLSKAHLLWSEVVYSDSIRQLGVINSDGVQNLRLVFSTTLRTLFNTVDLVPWLVEEKNQKHIHTLCEIGLDEVANAALAQIIPRRIEAYVTTSFRGVYDQRCLARVEQWVRDQLAPDLKAVLEVQKGANWFGAAFVDRLVDLGRAAVARLRIDELYDIVQTRNDLGISDLSSTLSIIPGLREEVVRSFVDQCEHRLLNGASDTVDIIQMYLKTVYAFSRLDPQGILLEKVSQPIRTMLKERSDTSYELAVGLFGNESSPLNFLFDELSHLSKPSAIEDLLQAFESWYPDPTDTPLDFVRKQKQDSVTILIDLFDNKEVFIKHFANLFSTELLERPFDQKTSLPSLTSLFELLAVRFGSSNMQRIAVMLDDVRKSNEVNRQIRESASSPTEAGGNSPVVNPLILSRLYWPSLVSTSEHTANKSLPAMYQDLLDGYLRSFAEQPRFQELELQWLPDHGRVTIQLRLADRAIDMVVRPSEAMVISAFSEPSQASVAAGQEDSPRDLTFADLASRTGLNETQLRDAIQFWVAEGVLCTVGECYRVLETSAEAEEHRKALDQATVDGGDLSLTGKAPQDDSYEEMHVYWSYIVGMLTNLGALNAEKIHSFLVMFVPEEDPYVKTKQELESYLLVKVDENELSFENNEYRLVKK